MKMNCSGNRKSSLSCDEWFMDQALSIAREALEEGYFPVGCVIECEGKVVAKGMRTHTIGQNVNEINHAEINVLKKLAKISARYDISKASLYCTLEPCLMCFGAILLSGITRVVFAYEDVMGGGTKCDLSKLPPLYAKSDMEVISGIFRNESLFLFKLFFSNPNNGYWKGSRLSAYTLSENDY